MKAGATQPLPLCIPLGTFSELLDPTTLSGTPCPEPLYEVHAPSKSESHLSCPECALALQTHTLHCLLPGPEGGGPGWHREDRGEGQGRKWGRQLLLGVAPLPHPVATEAGALTSPNRAASGLPPPQSLSRCHTASRERLTIIPHGVPYMTKLLRYFVSEDSIFLHLEHVQGEEPWGGVPFHALKMPKLRKGVTRTRCAAQTRARPCWRVMAGSGCVGPRGAEGRGHPGEDVHVGLARGHVRRCPICHHVLQSWLFSFF